MPAELAELPEPTHGLRKYASLRPKRINRAIRRMAHVPVTMIGKVSLDTPSIKPCDGRRLTVLYLVPLPWGTGGVIV